MYGASTPADACVAPIPTGRSSTISTDAPRRASSSATAHPTTPAPMTMMSVGRVMRLQLILRRMTLKTAAVTVLAAGTIVHLGAQTKPPVAPAEYGQFETLQLPTGGGLSPDGRWIAYGINRSNRSNELRVMSVSDGTTSTIAFGAQPAFSADSRWAAYAIGMSESQEEKLRSDKKPIHRKAGVLDLQHGEK